MPRCCDSTPDDFAPCYASVLVAGDASDLKRVVDDMEWEARISPCVTGWCSKCKRVSTLVTTRHLFPCPSAHLAHALILRARVEHSIRAWGLNENRR